MHVRYSTWEWRRLRENVGLEPRQHGWQFYCLIDFSGPSFSCVTGDHSISPYRRSFICVSRLRTPPNDGLLTSLVVDVMLRRRRVRPPSLYGFEVSTHSTITILVGYGWPLAFDAIENATRVAAFFAPRIFAGWRTMDCCRCCRRFSLGGR